MGQIKVLVNAPKRSDGITLVGVRESWLCASEGIVELENQYRILKITRVLHLLLAWPRGNCTGSLCGRWGLGR